MRAITVIALTLVAMGVAAIVLYCLMEVLANFQIRRVARRIARRK